MSDPKDYIAFVRGTEEVKQRLLVLIQQEDQSASAYLIGLINREYQSLFGETPPSVLLNT